MIEKLCKDCKWDGVCQRYHFRFNKGFFTDCKGDPNKCAGYEYKPKGKWYNFWRSK